MFTKLSFFIIYFFLSCVGVKKNNKQTSKHNYGQLLWERCKLAFYVAVFKYRLDAAVIPEYVANQQIALSRLQDSQERTSCREVIKTPAAVTLDLRGDEEVVVRPLLHHDVWNKVNERNWSNLDLLPAPPATRPYKVHFLRALGLMDHNTVEQDTSVTRVT